MDRHEWNGRAVTFADFTILQGRAVRAAFAEDQENGMYLCLVLSMRYADTGEPVFSGVDELLAQPFKLQQRLITLAAAAATVNRVLADTDEGQPVPSL